MKTAKTRSRISSAVTILATRIVQFSFYLIQNLKPVACFCDCTCQFVSDLVGNPYSLFFHAAAHMIYDLNISRAIY